MQAVILAAGRGTRMGTLTNTVPKPMLPVAGRTLLEHKFDALPDEIDEIIIIVGYLGEVIRARFGDSYKGKCMRYIEQTELNGTMGAVALVRDIVTGPFLIMMGDDIYSTDDIERTIEAGDWAMLLEKTEHMAEGGRIIADASGEVVDIEEGDHRGQPGLMNTNMFLLDARIFDYPMIPKSASSPEYGLPQTALAASKAGNIPLRAVYATDWLQVTNPEDLARAEKKFKTIEEGDRA